MMLMGQVTDDCILVMFQIVIWIQESLYHCLVGVNTF